MFSFCLSLSWLIYLQPEEELEKARIGISEYRNRSEARPSNVTYSAHKRLANEVQPENIFDSSSVKFSVKRSVAYRLQFVRKLGNLIDQLLI